MIAAVLVVAAHALLICGLLALILGHPTSTVPVAEPIVVSLIDQPWQPPVPAALRAAITPRLARPQVAFPRITEFRIVQPAQPVPSAGPNQPAAGSPGPLGPIDDAGATLTASYYVAPLYPPGAGSAGVHGGIVMAVLINAHWGIGGVRILHGTGSPQLDEAAVSAVRQWRFAPIGTGTRSGPLWGKVKVVFAPPRHDDTAGQCASFAVDTRLTGPDAAFCDVRAPTLRRQYRQQLASLVREMHSIPRRLMNARAAAPARPLPLPAAHYSSNDRYISDSTGRLIYEVGVTNDGQLPLSCTATVRGMAPAGPFSGLYSGVHPPDLGGGDFGSSTPRVYTVSTTKAIKPGYTVVFDTMRYTLPKSGTYSIHCDPHR